MSNDPHAAPPARPTIRRVIGGVSVVVFGVLLGLRGYAHRREEADRERQMRELIEASDRSNREVTQHLIEKAREEQQAELHRNILALGEQGRRIQVPPPLQLDKKPSATPSTPEPERHMSAREMPHELTAAEANIAAGALRQAPAGDVPDRAARKELQRTLDAIDGEMRALLGSENHFTDERRVAEFGPRVAMARARVEQVMKDGAHRKMLLRALNDLAADVRDFGDGGGPAAIDAGAR